MLRLRLVLTVMTLVAALAVWDFDLRFKCNIEQALAGDPQRLTAGPDGREARVGFDEDPDILLQRDENRERYQQALMLGVACKCGAAVVAVLSLALLSTFLIRKPRGSHAQRDSAPSRRVHRGHGSVPAAVPGVRPVDRQGDDAAPICGDPG